MNNISSWLPVVSWISEYKKEWIKRDVISGLITSSIVIPKAIAYAVIAGLPLQVGLYTAFIPLVIYAILGSSRPLSVTTTTTIAILTAAEIARITQSGYNIEPAALSVTLALMVGIILITARIFKLGFLSNFISAPVLTGFTAGIGIVILIGQIGSVFGIKSGKGSTVNVFISLLESIGSLHPLTLCIGIFSILVLVFIPRIVPKVPAPLVLVVSGIAASSLFGLKNFGVHLLDSVPTGLPSFSIPDVSIGMQLLPAAFGIALMSFTESISSARSFAELHDRKVDSNQELFAIGAANIAGSFFGTMPAGGGASQTAVNEKAGAKSQIAGLVTAAVVLLTMLFLAQYLSLMPHAVLGALLVVVGVSMIKPAEFNSIRRISIDGFLWALVSCAGVVLIGTLEGIIIAVVISMLTLIYYSNRPPVYSLAYNEDEKIIRKEGDNPEDVTYPGLLMVRIEGGLYFANVQRAGDRFLELMVEKSPKVVVLECSAIPTMEFTALKKLIETEIKMRENGLELWLAGVNPRVLNIIEISELGNKLGKDRIFHNIQKAIEAYNERKKPNLTE